MPFITKNICEKGEKSSKQLTCGNDQKSTVARKGKSPAFQRGLMNSGARTRNRTKDTGRIKPDMPSAVNEICCFRNGLHTLSPVRRNLKQKSASRARIAALQSTTQAAYSPPQTSLFRISAALSPAAAGHRRR